MPIWSCRLNKRLPGPVILRVTLTCATSTPPNVAMDLAMPAFAAGSLTNELALETVRPIVPETVTEVAADFMEVVVVTLMPDDSAVVAPDSAVVVTLGVVDALPVVVLWSAVLVLAVVVLVVIFTTRAPVLAEKSTWS
mmetsp:Transcript_62178/g.111994  ORF Transcript_62178/g.111994 Transcript_62178/m.111994 type:complete len:138 (+) Transcript_62178:448-861(+)